jgi:glutamate N-acetyltransferase/amino-acid N-acetyltransferase
VLTASTGVVGQRMPIQRIESALTELTAALHDDSAAFAAAIMTTDTTLKQVEVTLPGGARVVGVAKGSGMIHPNMATMLAFVMTDAKLPQNELRDMWRHVTERTFNQITVDGDTSPNDMAFVFSSGLVEAEPADLQAALLEVAGTLARKVARDGEGASKLITVSVTGARSDEEARAAARTVAGSPLVKAAVHGNDPNWGRILVALGRSGASFDQANVSIALQGATVYDGVPHPYDEAAVSDLLKQEDVLISASLGEAAGGSGTAWGCDLTAEYVRINADYTT